MMPLQFRINHRCKTVETVARSTRFRKFEKQDKAINALVSAQPWFVLIRPKYIEYRKIASLALDEDLSRGNKHGVNLIGIPLPREIFYIISIVCIDK